MTKVKWFYFCNDFTAYREDEMNKWLFRHRNDVEIIDIKISSFSAPNEDDPAEPHQIRDVLIIYRDKNEAGS